MDEVGLERLSVRKLSERLQVTPMALYRHVESMDDVLLAAADVLIGRMDRIDADDWRGYLTEHARSFRELLLAHPALTTLINRRPIATASSQARLAGAIDVMARAGIDPATATRAYASVHTYTVGYCTLEAGRRAGSSVPTKDDSTSELAEAIRGFVSEDQFLLGLEVMLRGLAPELDAFGAG